VPLRGGSGSCSGGSSSVHSGPVNPRDVIAFCRQFTVTKLHVVSAAEGGGRLADIGRYLLTPPGALFPKASCGQSGGCDGRGTGRANSKGRGQYWVGASVNAMVSVASATNLQPVKPSEAHFVVWSWPISCMGSIEPQV
jgi:hypothetical protein